MKHLSAKIAAQSGLYHRNVCRLVLAMVRQLLLIFLAVLWILMHLHEKPCCYSEELRKCFDLMPCIGIIGLNWALEASSNS